MKMDMRDDQEERRKRIRDMIDKRDEKGYET